MKQKTRTLFVCSLFTTTISICLVESIAAQQPSWTATGSVATARSLHTATPLSNGKVLVVGGINIINPCCTNTGSAELFDPATGQWTATGSPSTLRSNHIAVRLANGNVLIASGNGNPFSNILFSAEIYDPNTGTWSPAGNLNVARQSPRAVLLADGRVLVAGGLTVVGTTAVFTNTAEVYNPATNTWTATGLMNSGRVLHTLTLLQNGKVLAAGGSAAAFNPILTGNAEVYDPATNNWTSTGNLVTPRITHSATILTNGKVLVSGGSPDAGVTVIPNAELYDPATGQWTATTNMTSPRVLHTLTLLPNGRVLASAGAGSNTGGLSKSSELYDPATGNWNPTAELISGRLNHTATVLVTGRVLVTAGSGASQLTSAEIYTTDAPNVASVSAASFLQGGAPESIVASFGVNLAPVTQFASGIPLPTEINNVRVAIRDAAGVERLAPLFIVGTGQINYQIPAGSASGQAIVNVLNGTNVVAVGVLEIVKTSPGLFSANSNGQGAAAAVALRVSGGSQTYETINQVDGVSGRFVPKPINLGPATDEVFLILYGTGVRRRSAPTDVTCAIGGVNSEVVFSGATEDFVGLDQINVKIPRTLIGRGEVDVTITVEGRISNAVRVNIQ